MTLLVSYSDRDGLIFGIAGDLDVFNPNIYSLDIYNPNTYDFSI